MVSWVLLACCVDGLVSWVLLACCVDGLVACLAYEVNLRIAAPV
jgi:hypothetical protein